MEILKAIGYSTVAIFLTAIAGNIINSILRSKELRRLLKATHKKDKMPPDPTVATGIIIEVIKVVITLHFSASIIGKIFAICFNSSLVSSIAKNTELASTSDIEEKKSRTVVGMMLGEKLKRTSKTQVFLIATMIVNLLFGVFFRTNPSVLVFLITSACLLAIQIDNKLIEYRIINGWYGMNEFETREIVDFIISHASPDDFNDSGGLKKIIEPSDLSLREKNTNEVKGARA